MNQPPLEGVNAKPLTEPEVVKERFKEFDLALDQGTLDETTALLERLKSLPPTPNTAAKLLQKQADMARELGQLAQARQMYREARTLFQQLLDRRDWASCALREADMMLHLGETVAAYELYDQASRNHSAVLTKPELARGKALLALHRLPSQTLAGKDARGTPLAQQHRHAHYVADCRGPDPLRMTHLVVYAPGGFAPSELRAMMSLSQLHRAAGPLAIALQGVGRPDMLASSSRLFGTHRRYASRTPFVLPRHRKRGDEPEE